MQSKPKKVQNWNLSFLQTAVLKMMQIDSLYPSQMHGNPKSDCCDSSNCVTPGAFCIPNNKALGRARCRKAEKQCALLLWSGPKSYIQIKLLPQLVWELNLQLVAWTRSSCYPVGRQLKGCRVKDLWIRADKAQMSEDEGTAQICRVTSREPGLELSLAVQDCKPDRNHSSSLCLPSWEWRSLPRLCWEPAVKAPVCQGALRVNTCCCSSGHSIKVLKQVAIRWL